MATEPTIELQDKVNRRKKPYAHIVWHAPCRWCGVSNYLFADMLLAMHRHPTDDMAGEEIRCKSCRGRVEIKRLLPGFRATHLSDIRNRSTSEENKGKVRKNIEKKKLA